VLTGPASFRRRSSCLRGIAIHRFYWDDFPGSRTPFPWTFEDSFFNAGSSFTGRFPFSGEEEFFLLAVPSAGCLKRYGSFPSPKEKVLPFFQRNYSSFLQALAESSWLSPLRRRNSPSPFLMPPNWGFLTPRGPASFYSPTWKPSFSRGLPVPMQGVSGGLFSRSSKIFLPRASLFSPSPIDLHRPAQSRAAPFFRRHPLFHSAASHKVTPASNVGSKWL